MKTAMIISLCVILAGCATVEGVGEDISGGARRVSTWF
ncbi:entericidin EcnA/B family protein [Cognatishimia sp. WU-CL00825]